jgi:hypothetical protein
MLNMEVPIRLPAPTLRSGGLFVDVAVPIDTVLGARDRIGSGVVHVPWGCEPMFAGNAEICMMSGELVESVEDGIDTGATDLEPKSAAIREYPERVIHPPFKIVDGLECSVLSLPHLSTPTEPSMGDRLRSRMSLQISKMMMAELVSGQVSGGPSLLSEATTLTAASSMAVAAVRIETWLASVLHNGVGVVVLPVGQLAAAETIGWVNPSTLRTASGHFVIADAGFTGDPADPTSAEPGSFEVFGMSVPGQRYSDPKILEVASGSSHVDITDDMVAMINEAYAQIAFEPCSVGSVAVGG